MGTSFHIKVVADRNALDVDALRRDLRQVFAEITGQMSTYDENSEVSRFNRAPAGEWFAVSAPTARVAALALEMSRTTNGALDVTVAPLVRLWHFGAPTERDGRAPQQLKPPSPEAIERARKLVGYEKLKVRIDPAALQKSVEGLTIDLSTIAGGYVVDRVAEMLDRRGIENYMVEVGGEVRTRGQRADGQSWRIAIERPARNQREILRAVTLRDAALTTSGDYRNYFEFDGRRYSHIIDPKTGWPIEHELGSVSVLADECMTADAWDTALLILGPERGFELAEQHDIAALFVPPAGSDAAVRATSSWRERVE